jgi:hypothetical protein
MQRNRRVDRKSRAFNSSYESSKQLRYLRRDLAILHRLLDSDSGLPFKRCQLTYFYVIQTLYAQQKEMFDRHTPRITANRLLAAAIFVNNFST